MPEYEIFYSARMGPLRQPFSDLSHLSDIANEVQIGIRHLITKAMEMGVKLYPDKILVEAYQSFDGTGFEQGLYIHTIVEKIEIPKYDDSEPDPEPFI
jgi:hypothetical protein